jgi:membrane protein implicated in regulation of membrane protease activity
MKKTVNIFSGIFLALGILFACLPFGTGTLGFLPAAMALLLAAVSFFKTKDGKRKAASVLMIAAVTVALVVLVRNLTATDEVQQDDTQFEQTKQESEAESLQELQELEVELEGDLEGAEGEVEITE